MKTIKTSLLIVVSVLLCSLAQAQTAAKKVTTLEDVIKKSKETSRGAGLTSFGAKKGETLPDAQVRFSSNPTVSVGDIKPVKLSNIYSNENEDQIAYEKALNLQISELYKLVQKYKTSSNRGELWVRLAELYTEKARIIDNRIQDDYDKQMARYNKKEIASKPVLDLSSAQDYNKKAIQLYEWFVRDYPNDPKTQQALFFIGYNNSELGNNAASENYYNQLIQKYPNSNFSKEAHFAKGERYFEEEKWSEAYKEYAYLVKDNKHNLHPVSLYKASWCLYKLGKAEEAIKYMDYIVKSSRSNSANYSSGNKKVNYAKLENEALKDLIIFFVDVGDANRAVNYFKANAGQNAPAYIEKVAYYLTDRGNRESSSDIFRYLIKENPNGKKAFEYQYQIVQSYFYAKDVPAFKTELYKWITQYNAKSTWYANNQVDKNFIAKSDQLREQTLRNYVLQQHQTAQNSRGAFSQAAASEGYKFYFQEFPSHPQANNLRFFYGELLYDMGKYSEAAVEYKTAASVNTKYSDKAALNVLLSLEKNLPKEEEMQKKVGKSIESISLDDNTNKFIQSVDWYLAKYPNYEKAAELKFKVGRLYYLTNNFNQAEEPFKSIVAEYPKTKYADYSANLLLDMYSLRKDYAGLEKMGGELLKNQNIADKKVGQDIKGVLERTSFKRGQDLEVNKQYLASAAQYEAFAKQYPNSELANAALFNSAVNYERSQKNKEAIGSYLGVINSKNTSYADLKIKSKRLLAKLYQDTNQFDLAASYYEQLAQENSEPVMTPTYIYNSALMYEILDNYPAAIRQYSKFKDKTTLGSEKTEMVFKLAELNRKQKSLPTADALYKQYLSTDGGESGKKIEAMYWHSKDLNNAALLEDYSKKSNELLNGVSEAQKGNASSFAAKIKMKLANNYLDKLKSIDIAKVTGSQQKLAVDKKLSVMENLNTVLNSVVKLNSSEQVVEALALTGQANNHMYSQLKAAPLPTGLNEDQKLKYQAAIDKIAEPFQKKSVESFTLAVQRGREVSVYGNGFSTAYSFLNGIDSANYPLSNFKSVTVKKADLIEGVK